MTIETLPRYEKPEVVTYTDDEILEELGEFQATDYFPGTMIIEPG